MAVRPLARGFLLFFVCSGLFVVPLMACETPLIEQVANDAEFIGRVVPISTISVKGEEVWSERFETRARVVDGLRGSAGMVTLVSHQLLPEREMLVFGHDCGEWCAERDTYGVNATFALEFGATAERGGDWFEVSNDGSASVDLEALRAETIEGSESARKVVSWRELTRMISGAEAFLACRDDALPLDFSGCTELEGEDRDACWQDEWDRFNRKVQACRG
jgi:hypothetical protein